VLITRPLKQQRWSAGPQVVHTNSSQLLIERNRCRYASKITVLLEKLQERPQAVIR
jgi:hypothetical protein